jgi:hypothetical protein
MVLVGAAVLYNHPERAHGWGIAILVVSAVNVLFEMGGLFAGPLGITGGALALAWRPEEGGEGK